MCEQCVRVFVPVENRIKASNDEVLENIEAIVAEAGDGYVYRSPNSMGCVYQYAGEPSCLVGRVTHRMGLPLTAMTPYEGVGCRPMVESYFIVSLWALKAFQRIQRMQDSEVPYGECLVAAKSILTTGEHHASELHPDYNDD